MSPHDFVAASELRGRFAIRLAGLYGAEVPAYNTLVEVSRAVNASVLDARGRDAERLGDVARVSAERHGAIRVGSADELSQVARVFAAFGMHPVGFYDLRNSDGSGVPVVSTAFRPTDRAELARNPFRIFTSMLAADDSRFFDADTQQQLARFISARELFPSGLLTIADRAAGQGGLAMAEAATLLDLATEAFRLSQEPIDRSWYDHLAAISSVAADIGGVASTHINHLTPRVLDIVELYKRMQSRGIDMIDAIQGPPAWDGPDVLLRQTSFRALAERRWFRSASGRLVQGEVRVRFGEVEQRGIALTSGGLKTYEHAVTSIAAGAQGLDENERQSLAERVWRESFPSTESDMATDGIGWFAYAVTSTTRPPTAAATLSDLVRDGVLTEQPIVYEDFLPRSAAGIFRSNLSGTGSRDDSRAGAHYDTDRLAAIIGMDIGDAQQLYRAERDRSIVAAADQLGCSIVDDLPIRE